MVVERTEDIYVLYGSQTGNSEQAAKDLCRLVSTRLDPQSIQKLTGTSDVITVRARHMQLDDFLEQERCAWTRLIIVITSSYGVGGPPLGCYRFRDLADAWIQAYSSSSSSDNSTGADNTKKNPQILKGISYAMCGLGDSKFTTYFENPRTIDKALTLVGATRVGDLGQANASGTGELEQCKVIEKWMDGIWMHLANVVVQEPLSDETLKEMQRQTVELCRKINPEFDDYEKDRQMTSPMLTTLTLVVAALVALVAAILYYFIGLQHR